MESQQYSNHKRIDPPYHYVLSLLTVAVVIGSIFHLVYSVGRGENLLLSLLLMGFSMIALLQFIYMRRYPMVAQDRAIRAEENLRHYAIAGKLLDSRLTIGQIIALRFASDAELPELAARAAQESMKPDDIKKAIRSWRADHHRV
jgi:hypothetical protein